MPEGTGPGLGPQEPKPRIVQYRGRRYSIRLEPVFWHALDRLAERDGMRLGRLIAALAERFGGGNFSSHLRAVCMLEAERALARASLSRGRASLVDLIEAAFGPGLLLSRYRTIIACNEGFLDWLGPPRRPPGGADLTSVIQVRTRRPLNQVWLDMLAGTILRAEANVLHVQPGRVLAAPARFVALPAQEGEEFYAALWISAGRTHAPAPPFAVATGAPGAPERAR